MVRLLKRLLCLRRHQFRWRFPDDRPSELVCGRCGLVQPRGMVFLLECLAKDVYPRHGRNAYRPSSGADHANESEG